MSARVSRQKLAGYAAEQLLAGRVAVIQELAAFLIDTRRTKEIDLLVRDIEYALSQRGTAIADVAAAHELSGTLKKEIEAFVAHQLDAKTVVLRTEIDSRLIGGIKLNAADRQLDNTIQHKLAILRTQKV